jgi:hypothetical protein
MFIYPIYNRNWRNISTIYIYIYIYIYITRLASNETFSPPNKIHREVGRAKDLSAPLYNERFNSPGCIELMNLWSLNTEPETICSKPISILASCDVLPYRGN